MPNVIESAALYGQCAKAGLFMLAIDQHSPMEDVYIIDGGDLGRLNDECNAMAYKLSELLLAMIGKAELEALF